MNRTRIPKRRSKPRRVLGREKLYGKAKEARRKEIFERAGGRCEEQIAQTAFGNHWWFVRCPNPATEWSHNRHGANKDDSLSGGIASCKECHERRHHPKACPSKKVA